MQLEEGDRLSPAEAERRQQQRDDRRAQERAEDRRGQTHPGRPDRSHGQRYFLMYVCMYVRCVEDTISIYMEDTIIKFPNICMYTDYTNYYDIIPPSPESNSLDKL